MKRGRRLIGIFPPKLEVIFCVVNKFVLRSLLFLSRLLVLHSFSALNWCELKFLGTERRLLGKQHFKRISEVCLVLTDCLLVRMECFQKKF